MVLDHSPVKHIASDKYSIDPAITLYLHQEKMDQIPPQFHQYLTRVPAAQQWPVLCRPLLRCPIGPAGCPLTHRYRHYASITSTCISVHGNGQAEDALCELPGCVWNNAMLCCRYFIVRPSMRILSYFYRFRSSEASKSLAEKSYSSYNPPGAANIPRFRHPPLMVSKF